MQQGGHALLARAAQQRRLGHSVLAALDDLVLVFVQLLLGPACSLHGRQTHTMHFVSTHSQRTHADFAIRTRHQPRAPAQSTSSEHQLSHALTQK